jgi:hypothetical protein
LQEVNVAEEFLEFENTVEDEHGLSHIAVVVGEQRDDGRWIGRIRFVPTDGSEPLETDRETTQPDRDDLAYWATGLTYFYLEGALVRARRRAGAGSVRAPAAPAAPTGRPTTGPWTHHVPRLEVASMDPAIVERVLGARDARPGTARQVPGAGIIVYEGEGGEDGASHMFAVQFGSRNAGATLANWLWSRLHGLGVQVRVDGRIVDLTNDALNRAILG